MTPLQLMAFFWVVASSNATANEPEEIDVATFDCSTAPTVLGHPDASVVACGPFYGSPKLIFAWVTTPEGTAVKRLLLPNPNGSEPFMEQGLAAAGRYLEEGGLDRNRDLDEYAAMLFIKLADARPPGWTEMDGGGAFPGVGKSGFTANPFSLTLIRQATPPAGGRGEGQPLGRSGRGYTPPAPSLYQKAVLSRSGLGGIWQWQIFNWVDGDWEELTAVDLR